MEQNSKEVASGFTLQTQNFMVKFVCAFENGKVSSFGDPAATEVMGIILDVLELCPTSISQTKTFLAKAVNNWIIARTGFLFLNLSIKVDIKEEPYFTPPLSSKKSLRISFSNSEFLFHIKKKSIMKSLKDLGAVAVADNLENKRDIAELEIPITLIFNLLKEFNQDWNAKYYRKHLPFQASEM